MSSIKKVEVIKQEIKIPPSQQQSRWRSKYTWLAISAQLLTILGLMGVYERVGLSQDSLKVAITSILEFLVIIGIINNPTVKQEW